LPDPIPASLYERSPAAPSGALKGGTPGITEGGSVTNFRGWPFWKQALAAAVGVVGAVLVAQTPWRPALGVLGLLTLAIVVLAANAWGLQGRVPFLRSENPLLAGAAWGAMTGVLLLVAILVLVGPGPFSSNRHSTALMAPRPTPVAPGPTPAAIPVTAPPVTAAPAPASVTFLNAPLLVERGHTAILLARTAPDSNCSIQIGYPSPPELDEATSNGSGIVSWSWRVGRRVQPGSWPITISCRAGTGNTQITVT
jgi:hypothetical protein